MSVVDPDEHVVDPVVETILGAVAGFGDRYVALAEACDGDPGAAAAFAELADYVAELLTDPVRHRRVLASCSAAIDAVAEASEDGREAVAWSFLEALSPDDRYALEPWLGPRGRSLLAEVDAGPPS